VKLGGLKDADEHEDVASPSAEDLDHPALPHSGEDGIVTSSAIGNVPEDIATRGGAGPSLPVTPRRISEVSRCAARYNLR